MFPFVQEVKETISERGVWVLRIGKNLKILL